MTEYITKTRKQQLERLIVASGYVRKSLTLRSYGTPCGDEMAINFSELGRALGTQGLSTLWKKPITVALEQRILKLLNAQSY